MEASGAGGGTGVAIKEESSTTENLIDFQPKPIKNDFTEFLGDLYKLQTPTTVAISANSTETLPSISRNFNSAAALDLRYAPAVCVLPTGPINLRPQHSNTGNGQIQIGASTGAMPKSQSWTANLNRNQAEQRVSLPKSATTR